MRQFNKQLKDKYGEGTFELVFQRAENLATAYQLVEEIKTTLGRHTNAHLKVEEIHEKYLDANEEVLVVLVIWRTLTLKPTAVKTVAG
ncbi:hypothetical protein J2T02_002563 [Chitinophaga terrae (ex Kim and Jung 2007)]|uniref:hypothetical protein n=1 Tax=Chitinophaga terrae (ex Kim and Jung 2007) TaxID=408074 RepID=UPI002783E81D|nr:hypothetical protein [Chitinophaga terrae (ex Kim and Jung 2007)]MDQ0107444.1 hypothetical protein [Chitinophaga terrae (ex Kim and Jung 2007)]